MAVLKFHHSRQGACNIALPLKHKNVMTHMYSCSHCEASIHCHANITYSIANFSKDVEALVTLVYIV